jgi:3-deoxy-D-manno-octulosonic-acid transferase
VEARGWTVSRRSEYSIREHASASDIQAPVDVFCLDTVGELAVAYRYAQAAYVGGTLNSAGHNMAEPLYWGIPVSYGPARGFFETVKRACEAAGVGLLRAFARAFGGALVGSADK